jgi:hypothetical protein
VTPSADLQCRRCGQTPDAPVVIYGPDQFGSLLLRAVQCRGRCNKGTGRRQDTPARTVTMTANRPGRCPGCELDIVPSDVLARAGGQSFHYECTPAEDPRQQSRRRERTRTRQA